MKELVYKAAFVLTYCAFASALFIPLAYFNFEHIWSILFSVYACYLALSALFFGYVAILEPDERRALSDACRNVLSFALQASTGLALIGVYQYIGPHFGLVEQKSMDGDFPNAGYFIFWPVALFVRAGALIGTTLVPVAFLTKEQLEKNSVKTSTSGANTSASKPDVVVDIERVRVYRR